MQSSTTTQAAGKIESRFGFDLEKLKIGDVLLSSDNTPMSATIARATRGEFSHAMLYVGHSLIHAMPDGVYSKNPQRYIRDAGNQLAVYRLLPELSHESIFDAACDYARAQVGALYSVPAAALSKALSHVGTQSRTGKQFCSRLVAQAYARAGVALVPKPDFCSPNDLARSACLQRVPDAMRELGPNEISFANSEDFNAVLQQKNFQWLDKTRRMVARRGLGEIHTQNDVLPMLVKHPGYDKVVSKFVLDSGYPDFYDWDRAKNSYRYDARLFLGMRSDRRSLIELVESEIPSVQADLKRHAKNYDAASENMRNLPTLQYLNIFWKLARNLLEETHTRRQTLIEVSQQIDYSLDGRF
jgi:hypothetical protein